MAKNITKQDILRFAKHEAGHAVHHVLTFAHEFDFVWVRRSIDEVPPKTANGQLMSWGLGGCMYRSSDEIYCTTFDYVANYMAGLAGERINRKKPGTMDFVAILSGCKGDWRGAREAIKESNEKGLSKWYIKDDQKFMDDALKSVHEWMTSDRVRRAHTAVVKKLIECGRLTYAEVKAIVEEQFRG